MLLLKITKFFPHCYIQAPSARVGGGVAPNPRPLPEIRFQLCRYSARGLLISPGISLTDLNRYRYSGSARLLSSIIHKLVDFSSLSLSVSQSLSLSVSQSLSLSVSQSLSPSVTKSLRHSPLKALQPDSAALKYLVPESFPGTRAAHRG